MGKTFKEPKTIEEKRAFLEEAKDFTEAINKLSFKTAEGTYCPQAFKYGILLTVMDTLKKTLVENYGQADIDRWMKNGQAFLDNFTSATISSDFDEMKQMVDKNMSEEDVKEMRKTKSGEAEKQEKAYGRVKTSK